MQSCKSNFLTFIATGVYIDLFLGTRCEHTLRPDSF